MPRKNMGAMLAETATPTMKGESVLSSTNHPRVTFSIPQPREWQVSPAQSMRKSRY
jgi:hypothetical protein